MNTVEEGKKLIRQGQWVLERDLQTALEAGNFNLAVRRAQEVVELVLKGGLRALGADYPKVHDVASAFCEQVRQKSPAADEEVLEQIRIISLWLSEARAPSFYFERDYGVDDARRAFQDARFVLSEVKEILGLA